MDGKEYKLVQLSPIELENLLLNTLAKHERIKLIKQQEVNLLTKSEAARKLKVSYNTLMRRINAGLLSVRADGKITEKSLNRYINM